MGVSPINNRAFKITTKTGDIAQIGDPTKPTFSPEVALSRWSGECKLKLPKWMQTIILEDVNTAISNRIATMEMIQNAQRNH